MPNSHRWTRASYLFCTLILAALLSACQSFQTQTAPLSSQQQYISLAKIKHWQVKGKISLRYGEERQNASFTWEQKKKKFNIHLFGPMGQGSTWLKKTNRGVSLKTSDDRDIHATTPEELMQQTLGWQVPISNLQSWIIGNPAPLLNTTTLKTDELGFITAFEQDGWQIEYAKQQRYKGLMLPGKIVISQADMRLMVIIKDWNIPSLH